MAERTYEKFLRGVITRSLDAEVEHVDDGSRNGMHDAEVRYPDGRIAAVEFTSVGERAAFQMDSMPTELLLPTTSHWWTLRYGQPGVLWRDIKQHVPVLVTLLDQQSLTDADQLRPSLRGLPAWNWYDRHDLSLSHFGSTSQEGRVDVLPRGGGGVVDSQYTGLNSWVASIQSEPWWEDNVAKLVRSGHTELHLALRVHETGIPFSLLYAIIDGDPIPADHPTGMEPLTDLWIVTSYGTNAVHWSARDGWIVHSYATADEHAATVKKNSEILKRIIEAAERSDSKQPK
jgi:hypothetical protein